MILVYPGSFDPPTNGHLDIIKRSSKLADRLHVVILHNPAKKAMFSLHQRKDMLAAITKDFDHIIIDDFSGLLVDYAKLVQADAVVRGLRNGMDYEMEAQMAECNRKLGDLETLFLKARPEWQTVSSSAVREILAFQGDIQSFVPSVVDQMIKDK